MAKLRSLGCVVAGLALGAFALTACTEGFSIAPASSDASTADLDAGVDPDEDAGAPPDEDAASPRDAGTTDAGRLDAGAIDAGPFDAGAFDAGIVCNGGAVVCGAVCVDTRNDPKNCGACGHDCLGSACSAGLCKEEKVSPAGSARAIDIAGGVVYWTEQGASNAVRKCPTTGCASLPASLTTPQNAMGIAVPAGANAIFYTENQYGSIVIKMGLGGASPTGWTGRTSNGAGIVQSGTDLYWGSSEGLYRSAQGASGASVVFVGSLSGAVENGPQTIAVDAKNVYAAPGGTPLRACPLGADCSTSGGTVIANEPSVSSHSGVGAIASDGTNVFYTGGKLSWSGTAQDERLVRCPVTGCAGGVPEVLWSRTTTTNTASHVGIALDASNVYWGTVYGSIYALPKGCTAPCTAREIVTGAQPWGLKVDGAYLYWADKRGGIYRVVRP